LLPLSSPFSWPEQTEGIEQETEGTVWQCKRRDCLKVKNYFQAVLNLDPLENFFVAIGCRASLSGLTLLEAFVPAVECGHDVVCGELAGRRLCLP